MSVSTLQYVRRALAAGTNRVSDFRELYSGMLCKTCMGSLEFRPDKHRSFIDYDGKDVFVHTVTVPVGYCATCRRYRSVALDFAVPPYSRFSARFLAFLMFREEELGVEETISYFSQTFGLRLSPATVNRFKFKK